MTAATGQRPLPRDPLPRAAIEALVSGRHGDPFAVLGPHRLDGDRWIVRVFRPGVGRALLIDAATGEEIAELNRIHRDGLFSAMISRPDCPHYRLRFIEGDHAFEEEDAYRFPPVLGELDNHLFAEGRHLRLYEKLGAHPAMSEGISGTSFAVFAPNASRVSVVGDFNGWDGRRHSMRKRQESGLWEIFLPGIGSGQLYKYELLGPHGELLPLKADPFGFEQEQPPSTASRIHGLPNPSWHDEAWRAGAAGAHDIAAPIAIYEVHLGSWRRGAHNSFLDYDALAATLVPYVKDMGFTHIELLPITEHPFYGSWGYQPIGLFAPTARYGTPEAFTRFVESCHAAGIGLIMDWVPAHFPSDPHGLGRFDGTALYEHQDPRQGFHRDWNTLIYNYGRREVANFLLASALFWLERYHIDGLRVDAVASMLYLDYSRPPGEWIPNIYGGRENIDAVKFIRDMNTEIYAADPGAVTLAEESTAWPRVSHPVHLGGLGFGYKWNMGWMHDTLDYMSRDPIHRRYHHDRLTFGLLYAFSENFILPLSHDEVVHGKRSILGRMPGDRWQRFANLRAYYAFMWCHPGKKLIFMGGEFGQEQEWAHEHSLDWHLIADPMHRSVQDLVRELNRLYRSTPALHRLDSSPDGFSWVDANDADNSVLSFLRFAPSSPPVLVVCNFTPVVREGYRVGVPVGGYWRERINTDAACYGGSNVGNAGGLVAEGTSCHNRPFSLRLTLPPLATLIFEHVAG
jgi:1,4-alpha-glucan branching enzyme